MYLQVLMCAKPSDKFFGERQNADVKNNFRNVDKLLVYHYLAAILRAVFRRSTLKCAVHNSLRRNSAQFFHTFGYFRFNYEVGQPGGRIVLEDQS
jgi:hypothetical protein